MNKKEEIEYMNSCMTEYYESLDSLNRRGYIKSMLKRDIIKVVFTKVDDTTREMYCTLQDEFVPEHKKYYSASESSREKNMGTLSVFDLEKGDWRSFRIESVTDFGIVHEETLEFEFDKTEKDFSDVPF